METMLDLSLANRYRGSLHLYDGAIVLATTDGISHCIDPLDVATAFGNLPVSTGLLPADCLFWGMSSGLPRVGVLVPPQVWLVTVGGEEQPWDVPMPPLILVGCGTNYWVYALRGGNYPRPDSMVYRFPGPNANKDGKVCRGDAPFPAANGETIWQAVKVFFGSGFNKDLSNGKSKKYDGCALDMWRELKAAEASRYPVDDLVYAGMTVKELVNAAA